MAPTSLKTYFAEHPDESPYKSCPSCGCSKPISFISKKRPSELVYYCPHCEWNDTVVDMLATLGVGDEDTAAMFLVGEIIYTVGHDGLRRLENTARI